MKIFNIALPDQKNAIDDYDVRMNLSKEDKIALHRLFSPYRVPLGLTDQEVRVCIKLDGLRNELRDHDLTYFLIPFGAPVLLDNMEQDIPRTEEFKVALYNFIITWANK